MTEGSLYSIGILVGLAAILTMLVVNLRARIRSMTGELRELQPLREEVAVLRAARDQNTELEGRLQQVETLYHEECKKSVGLERDIEGLKNTHQARIEELSLMKKEIEDKFSNLASGVLKSNSETFLGLVTERFKQHSQTAEEELGKRQTAIENLVKPLDEKLGQFDRKVEEIERARNKAYGEIREQVILLKDSHHTLGQETRKLVQALRAPKTRGRWGEMQLRRVFEMAGMTEHVDFGLEESFDTDAGARRPDAIVQIPGGKSVVVDAKTPLQAYLDAVEAPTPEEQQAKLAQHAAQVRTHVRMLASKAYQDALETTPDFVVMFIPGETFVSAAAEVDPNLLEYSFENKVLIATPTTLMALIKAIAYGWQQERMAQNAADVQRLARELYDRLGKFGEHMGRVGRSLGQSVNHYNNAVGSLEGRVLPTARKFEAMGVVSPQALLEQTESVDAEPRGLTATEFGLNLAESEEGGPTRSGNG